MTNRPKASPPPPESNATPAFVFRHFPQLDGLRGVAIILLLIGHERFAGWHIPERRGSLASLGVMIFFVLSGFLITGLLCREEQKQGRISIAHFYVNRALRIFPAYYFFLAAVVVLIWLGLITDVPWSSLAVCAVYLRNIFGRDLSLTHIWSLSIEEQFYLIWPWVVWKMGYRKLLGWSLAAAGGIVAWRTVAICLHLWSYEAGRFYVRPDFRFDSILAGCAIALFFFKYGTSSPRARRLARLTHPLWIYPALIGWTLYAEDKYWARPYLLTVQLVLAAGAVFNLVARENGRCSRALSQGWLRAIGKLSYSIYLWQQIFLITTVPDWGRLRSFPFDLIMSCAAGTASYLLIERPFLRFKERIRNRPIDLGLRPWFGSRRALAAAKPD